MIYRVRHRTIYDYEDPVSVSHHLLRLTPRMLPGQLCRTARISILPAPATTITNFDYFGNFQTFFTLQEPHSSLAIEAASELEVYSPNLPDFSASPPWESVVESLVNDHSEEGLDAYQFVFGSQRVTASRELADYAREAFPALPSPDEIDRRRIPGPASQWRKPRDGGPRRGDGLPPCRYSHRSRRRKLRTATALTIIEQANEGSGAHHGDDATGALVGPTGTAATRRSSSP